MRTCADDQLGECFRAAARRPIRAALEHCLEGVRDGDDACAERDLGALQSIRVTRAVPALVVRAHDGQNVR